MNKLFMILFMVLVLSLTVISRTAADLIWGACYCCALDDNPVDLCQEGMFEGPATCTEYCSGNYYDRDYFTPEESCDPNYDFDQLCPSTTTTIPTITTTTTTPTGIPSLTEWGMIIFVTVLLGIGVVILRKRRLA